MVVEDFTEPDVRLDYGRMANHSPSKNARGSILQSRNNEMLKTADTYDGFDRFGRVVQQVWTDYGADPDDDIDKYTYGHDRNSNRLYRENTETSAKDELYAYDRLNRLTTFHRGNLNGTKTGIPTTESNRVRGQAWGLSPVGNWEDGRTASRSAWKNAGSSILHAPRTISQAMSVVSAEIPRVQSMHSTQPPRLDSFRLSL